MQKLFPVGSKRDYLPSPNTCVALISAYVLMSLIVFVCLCIGLCVCTCALVYAHQRILWILLFLVMLEIWVCAQLNNVVLKA